MRYGVVFSWFIYLHFIVWFSYHTHPHLHLLRSALARCDVVLAVVSVKLSPPNRSTSFAINVIISPLEFSVVVVTKSHDPNCQSQYDLVNPIAEITIYLFIYFSCWLSMSRQLLLFFFFFKFRIYRMPVSAIFYFYY